MTEKDTASKLEILLKRNLYSLALSVSESQQLDESYTIDILRK